MADILRHPWLERTIDQELSDVLERWGNNEVGNPQETQQNGDLPFEDDGSNLRIASTRPRVAQIVKVRMTISMTLTFGH